MSIAVIYPDDFPGRTTRTVLYPVGVRLAIAEKAKIVLGAEVDRAIKLVARAALVGDRERVQLRAVARRGARPEAREPLDGARLDRL